MGVDGCRWKSSVKTDGAWEEEVEHGRWSMGGGGGEKKEPLFQMKHTFSLLGNSGDVEHANDEHAKDDGQSNPSNLLLILCCQYAVVFLFIKLY